MATKKNLNTPPQGMARLFIRNIHIDQTTPMQMVGMRVIFGEMVMNPIYKSILKKNGRQKVRLSLKPT